MLRMQPLRKHEEGLDSSFSFYYFALQRARSISSPCASVENHNKTVLASSTQTKNRQKESKIK